MKTDFSNTISFIFEMAASRMSQRKKSLNLTNEEIAGWKIGQEVIQEGYVDPTGQGEDEPEITKKAVFEKTQFTPQMISRILNANIKAPKGRNSPNPYLFPTAKKGNKGYLEQIKETLKFTSTSEIMWGNHNSNDDFYFGLFCALIADLKDTEHFSTIQECLKDFIPYSKFLAYSETTDTSVPLEYLIGYSKFELDYFLSDSEKIAIYRLFEFIKYDFIDDFQEFISYPVKIKNYQDWTFKFIKKYLEKFTSKYFIPLLEKNVPESTSLGLRVYSIAKDDIAQSDFIDWASLSRSPESAGHWLTAGEKDDVEVSDQLLSASKEYIDKLEEIEIDLFGDFKEQYKKAYPENLLMEDIIRLEDEFQKEQLQKMEDEIELQEEIDYQENQELESFLEQQAEQDKMIVELEKQLSQDEDSKSHGTQ